MYIVQKVLTKLNNNECSGFLDPQELNDVKRKLDKNSYSIYYPYKDSEKNIIYNKRLPKVLLYEIKSKINPIPYPTIKYKILPIQCPSFPLGEPKRINIISTIGKVIK